MQKIRKSASPSFIEDENDIRAAVRNLRRRCGFMRRIHDATGDPPLRRRPAGFEGLTRIIVSQQLSTASAGAIWTRLATSVDPLSAKALLKASDTTLRAAGLSGPKVRTLRALASAVAEGRLQFEGIDALSDDEVRSALCGVSGIGPWTADIFLMFCLGRADAFAAGDLALQVAAQHVLALDERPTAPQLLEIAERWRPMRGVAARLLWAYHPIIKQSLLRPTTPV